MTGVTQKEYWKITLRKYHYFKEYHIVLGPEDNLHCLLKYSGGVVGYDTKYDFMAARFKTSAVTFCDNQNKGRVGILGLCNKEDTNTHTLHF